MSTITVIAAVGLVLGWLATGLDDLVATRRRPWNWRSVVKALFGAVAIAFGVCVLVSSDLRQQQEAKAAAAQREEAAASVACALLVEAERNLKTLDHRTRVSLAARYSVDAAAAHVLDPAEIDRYLRMLEGAPFQRSTFTARSVEVRALPGDIQGRIFTLYQSMDLCEQQVTRVVREVRAESKPDLQFAYLKILQESVAHLERPLEMMIEDLKQTCGRRTKR